MTESVTALEAFDPRVREWFLLEFPEPTPVQVGVWECVARGEHVLAGAPTGNGKTLAAFLSALSALAQGEYPADSLSVLYVSPLKALNEDIRRNLLDPIEGISALARRCSQPIPDIRVETRSGDTPGSARRRFLSHPPAILCTTPESLAILLDSPRARPLLSKVRLLIVDELHAVAGNKRGAMLACSIGRLALLAGEFRRIALSATLRPPEALATWFAGLRMNAGGPGSAPEPRSISVVTPLIEKTTVFSVEWPSETDPSALVSGKDNAGTEAARYGALVPALRKRIEKNRSTMIFCDARRRAERLAHLLNEGQEGTIAFAHHGSMSHEVREGVERRLKEGRLKAVVATSSLELGIDVGSIDEVILAGSPPSIAQALQRAGRAGHSVGLESRVTLFPFHGLDLLAAAAIVREARRGVIEETRPILNPLDILAQLLLSLAAEGGHSVNDLFRIVKCLPPFEELSRSQFDGVLALLSGRWSDEPEGGPGLVRELEPRIRIEGEGGLVRAAKGALRLLLMQGGTIPDRGLYAMRLEGEGKKLGELDEEFVFERKVGDAFAFGTQSWRITAIGSEAVTVRLLPKGADSIPFWKGSPNYESPELAAVMLSLLDAIGALGPKELREFFSEECCFSEEAAAEGCRLILAQRRAQGQAALPGSRSVALEFRPPGDTGKAASVLLHTARGGRVNEALALVLSAAVREAGLNDVMTMADDGAVLILLPGMQDAGDVIALLSRMLRSLGERDRMEELLRGNLEASGLFASSFRENAGRSLLLPKGFPGKRVPLWITRQRASRLFAAVRGRGDFPVTLETWRSVRIDLPDIDGLSRLLSGLASGEISLEAFVSDYWSPFGGSARWAETGEYLYRADDLGKLRSGLSPDAISEALESAARRPALSPEIAESFGRKKLRLLAAWAPEDPLELADWIGDLVAVTQAEAEELSGLGGFPEAFRADPSAGGRLARLRLEGATIDLIVNVNRALVLSATPLAFIAEYLRHRGPVRRDYLESLFGGGRAALDKAIAGLRETRTIIDDAVLGASPGTWIVDRNNCDIILRMGRRSARPSVSARPSGDLFRFIAAVQGLPSASGGGTKGILPSIHGPEAVSIEERDSDSEARAFLDSLSGYPAPVRAMLDSILPARLGPGAPRRIGGLFETGQWLWFGTGREAMAFATPYNYELFAPPSGGRESILGRDGQPLDFHALLSERGAGASAAALEARLWEEAWEGLVSSDSLLALIRGLEGGFGERPGATRTEALPLQGLGGRRMPRGFGQRLRGPTRMPGKWLSLSLEGGEGDALDRDELDRERVRILVARYGILIRPLLERELPGLSWKRLFAAMRRMELAGELAGGLFFEGVPAPQFIARERLGLFGRLGSEEKSQPFWLSALDPASPAGFLFDVPQPIAPPRRLGTFVCIKAGIIQGMATRGGKELRTLDGLGEELTAEILGAWARRPGKLMIEIINGRSAPESPWASLLLEAGLERDRGVLRRW